MGSGGGGSSRCCHLTLGLPRAGSYGDPPPLQPLRGLTPRSALVIPQDLHAGLHDVDVDVAEQLPVDLYTSHLGP